MAFLDSTTTLTPSLLDRLIVYDPRTTSPLFSIFDLLNPSGLTLKFRHAEDPVSAHVREQFTPDLQSVIDELDGTTPVPGLVQEGIIDGLNKLVDGELVYDRERFRDISLAEATIRLIDERPNGRGLMFLNRWLLEDTYPRYLQTRRVQAVSYSLRELKESVSRDMEALLNTRRELFEELPSAFKEVSGSLLCYGLPDFTAMDLMNHKDRKQINRTIEQAVTMFEPRLRAVKVTVLNPSGLDQALHFRIEAMLQVDPEPEAVRFDAVLQLSTAKYEVAGE